MLDFVQYLVLDDERLGVHCLQFSSSHFSLSLSFFLFLKVQVDLRFCFGDVSRRGRHVVRLER